MKSPSPLQYQNGRKAMKGPFTLQYQEEIKTMKIPPTLYLKQNHKFYLSLLSLLCLCFLCSCNPAKSLNRTQEIVVSQEQPQDDDILFFDRKDVSKRERDIFRDIEQETYGDELQRYTFDSSCRHVYYISGTESYVVGDCAFYAFVRWLRHACQLGLVSDPDLWKKYSIQDLRNIMVDRMIEKGYPSRFEGIYIDTDGTEHCKPVHLEDYRKMQEWIVEPPEAARFLLHPLNIEFHLFVCKKIEPPVEISESKSEHEKMNAEYYGKFHQPTDQDIRDKYMSSKEVTIDENYRGCKYKGSSGFETVVTLNLHYSCNY